jgi:holo-[acyl-carrier protein] synthase
MMVARARRGKPVIVGLGVDLVECDRVAGALERWGERLVSKLMGPEEAGGLPSSPLERAQSLALAIAAKEAASKALGTGWSRGVRWRDVEVALGPLPSLRLMGRAAQVAKALGSGGKTRLRLDLLGNLVISEVRLLS